MSRVTSSIPEELQHPLFFQSGEISWEQDDEKNWNFSRPFIYDCAYFVGFNSLTPWFSREVSVPGLLQQWEKLKEPLRNHFSNRNKTEAASLMKLGTAFFLEFLFWSNRKPVRLYPQISYDELQIKPVNIKERLDFIVGRQNTYHSFMQLVELFTEMEKLFAKSKVIYKK